MYQPRATYRFQIHANFNLTDIRDQLDYLEELGISTIYAAPILEARVGSTHGYDVINPLRINPEVGTKEALVSLSEELQRREIGWIQDIVPNHMAFSTTNPWLASLLELGPRSPYFTFFDVHWWNDRPDNYGKLMMPILGGTLKEEVDQHQLKLSMDSEGFAIRYYEHRIPLAAHSYGELLSEGSKISDEPTINAKFLSLLDEYENLYPSDDSQFRIGHWEQFKNSWQDVFFDEKVRLALQPTLDERNDHPETLMALLSEQHFRLAYWKETEKEIYYRRFFTVNDLICLNMQDEKVFSEYHQLIAELIRNNVFQGLRIDHIDGLFDPNQYLDRLRALLGEEPYLVVEKILEGEEELPSNWSIQGTTGYDFLVRANQLFSSSQAQKQLTALYQDWKSTDTSYADQVYDNKMFVLKERMKGELTNLAQSLYTLQLLPETNMATAEQLEEALAHILVSFPVYRIYDNQLPLSKESLQLFGEIFNRATTKAPHLQPAFDTLRIIFNGVPDKSAETNTNTLYFIQRCQQFSGPLAAKGIEDTTFYQYNRLVSRNEVGDSPDKLGMTADEFHQWARSRGLLTMNSTATHDTKRGEDARMRINVLSEQVDQWAALCLSWKQQFQKYGLQTDGKSFPTENDRYFIYQTIVGTYPFHTSPIEENYAERLQDYFLKAIREAKVNSSWSNPHEEYEHALRSFTQNLLGDNSFIDSLKDFAHPLARKSVTYSLGQLLLKVTAPGIPDIYQGTEFWDLSLVDPDNRRPVNYQARQFQLQRFQQSKHLLELSQELIGRLDDPAIKMYALYRSLQLRKRWESLFAESYYEPLVVTGSKSSNVVAFLRRHLDRFVVVVIPREVVGQLPQDKDLALDQFWEGTDLTLPGLPKDHWQNEFTGEILHTSTATLPLSAILRHFPVALLTNQQS
jgi:(1->4)-alpha-D-glucan 1-alpha-D-glucosylmutase